MRCPSGLDRPPGLGLAISRRSSHPVGGVTQPLRDLTGTYPGERRQPDGEHRRGVPGGVPPGSRSAASRAAAANAAVAAIETATASFSLSPRLPMPTIVAGCWRVAIIRSGEWLYIS
jgi:hypothetical protein